MINTVNCHRSNIPCRTHDPYYGTISSEFKIHDQPYPAKEHSGTWLDNYASSQVSGNAARLANAARLNPIVHRKMFPLIKAPRCSSHRYADHVPNYRSANAGEMLCGRALKYPSQEGTLGLRGIGIESLIGNFRGPSQELVLPESYEDVWRSLSKEAKVSKS
ncbi:unnamed protein product, partial [Iphiclides podalirius]